MDPPPRSCGGSVPRTAAVARRSRRRHGHRRLPLVRRLGPRHDDRAARPHAGDGSHGRGSENSDDVRALRGPRAAAESLPGRRPGAGVQHGRRDALVLPGDSRVSRGDRRRRPAQGPLSDARVDPRLASPRHALWHSAGPRRWLARRGRAWRATHMDGREGRRPGRDAAHRQARRDQRALVQRSRGDDRLRAAAAAPRQRPRRRRRARGRGIRALLECARRLVLRRA